MTESDGADWLAIEGKFYDFLMRHERIGDTAQQHIFAAYAEYFTAGQRVLDVGPGHGDFLDLLRERGVTGFGLDHDPGMVAESRRRGHTMFESDAIAFLRNTRRRFDGVFMGNFVEHFAPQDVLALLQGSFRVLRPGGTLIVATVDPRSLHIHLQEFWRDATHARPYDRDLLAFMAETSGFTVREVGSNDTTAYTPGDEWFGPAFAARLAAIGDTLDAPELFLPEPASPPMPAESDYAEEGAVTPQEPAGELALVEGEHGAAADHNSHAQAMGAVEARLAFLQETIERVQRDAGGAARSMRQEIADLRTALDDRSTNISLPPQRPFDPSPFVGDGVGGETAAPLLIPERRSAMALRRWKQETDEARDIPTPRPYRRLPTDPTGVVPQAVFALLINIYDEVRLTTETTHRQHDRFDQLDRRLDRLGEIVALTQGEIVQGMQAIRARIEAVQEATGAGLATQVATARRIAEELDAIWRAFADAQRAREATTATTTARLADLQHATEDLQRGLTSVSQQATQATEDLQRGLTSVSQQVTQVTEDLQRGLISASQQATEQATRATEQATRATEDVHGVLATVSQQAAWATEQAARATEDLRRVFTTVSQHTARETHARIASVDTLREQVRSIFDYLYPPREYFVVAVRGEPVQGVQPSGVQGEESR